MPVIVRQQTENEFADLDPEDTRYNFFRWIASGSAYAMGAFPIQPHHRRNFRCRYLCSMMTSPDILTENIVCEGRAILPG